MFETEWRVPLIAILLLLVPAFQSEVYADGAAFSGYVEGMEMEVKATEQRAVL